MSARASLHSRRSGARSALIAAVAAASAVLSLTACEDAEAQPGAAAASSAAASITISSVAVALSPEKALPPRTPLLEANDGDALRAAAARLDAIPVKGRAPNGGYDRALLGQAWFDDVTVESGHNGWDTRNDIPRWDLVR